MNALVRLLKWLVTGALFVLLFAFSLNNQTPVQLHFIFGWSGKIPLIMVVLASVGCGVVLGVLGMLPHWLRLRRNFQKNAPSASHFATPPTDRHSAHVTDYGA